MLSGKSGKSRVRFVSETEIHVADVVLDLDSAAAMFSGPPTRHRFPMLKSAEMVRLYDRVLGSRRIEGVLELGIFKGGSCAFFNALLRPRVHAAVDFATESWPALNELAADVTADGRVLELRYGLNQTDEAGLSALATRLFTEGNGQSILDLVVDDASHQCDYTRQSLNVLLPRLRPGGVYAVEDWGWAHYYRDACNPLDYPTSTGPATTNLIFELTMLCAGRDDIVSEIIITPDVVLAVRGSAALPVPFDVASSYRLPGSAFRMI